MSIETDTTSFEARLTDRGANRIAVSRYSTPNQQHHLRQDTYAIAVAYHQEGYRFREIAEVHQYLGDAGGNPDAVKRQYQAFAAAIDSVAVRLGIRDALTVAP